MTRESGCVECPKNTYSSYGAMSCTTCPDGTFSPAGSGSESDCQTSGITLQLYHISTSLEMKHRTKNEPCKKQHNRLVSSDT